MKKQKIKVPFTRAEHQTVNAFLDYIRSTGQVERDLGSPVKVVVEWVPEEEGKAPSVILTGSSGLQKIIPIKDILAADDSTLKGPHLKLVGDAPNGN